MKEKKCRNWAGLNFKTRKCKADMKHPSPPNICMGKGGECEKYDTFTQKELQQQEKEMKHAMDCVVRGVSSCCEAEIDHSHQIPDGRHKGHGPHYCSKCKKLAYYV